VPLLVQGDNPPLGDSVGAIEGDSISIEGPMSVDVVHGQVRTVLARQRCARESRAGAHQAGGRGRDPHLRPAHFSVLKSGGALTLALEGGVIHAHLENDLALTVYTPQIQARPISIGNGPEDVLVGLDSSGAMCIRANKGAVRIEQQLTGQSVLVPQNGDVSLSNGQLESCEQRREVALRRTGAAIPAQTASEVSVLASPEEIKKAAEERKVDQPPATVPPPAEKQEPVYQVFIHRCATTRMPRRSPTMTPA